MITFKVIINHTTRLHMHSTGGSKQYFIFVVAEVKCKLQFTYGYIIYIYIVNCTAFNMYFHKQMYPGHCIRFKYGAPPHGQITRYIRWTEIHICWDNISSESSKSPHPWNIWSTFNLAKLQNILSFSCQRIVNEFTR